LIAKLIAFGRDRSEAVARMNRALDTFVIEGIDTSLLLHKRIINHERFIQGEYGTSFLGEIGIV
jgi:acetyl-CoA carboxylase biotin carboxylase subunit